jgi:FixJ family two-component response regulator
VEPHPAVLTVLEYLLVREGYAVEAFATEEPFVAVPGPALLLVAVGDGLYVFLSEDVSETLGGFVPGTGGSPVAFSGATGIQAFLPKPFGVEDVLRVVKMVGGFEGRRREHSRRA